MQQSKKIVALILIPVILFTGIGFSVSQHFCMGMLKSESFYSPAEKCAIHENKDRCENPQSSYQSNCCEDQNLSIPGLEFKRVNEHQAKGVFLAHVPIKWSPVPPLASRVFSKPIQNLNLHPPEDFLISFQRFLI